MGLNNFTFVAGTQPLGSGSQKCLNFSINDDKVVERTEKFVVCGYSEKLAIFIQDNNCVDIYIEDNDGKTIWLQF